MCQKGVNTDQMKMMVGQADDTLAMAQQWLEQIHHLADHADMTHPSSLVAQASVLLGEARAKLDRASVQMETGSSGPEASVELV
jgi:hypothetical protein